MRYIRFEIEKYKGVKDSKISVINEPIPIIGINESGKSSVLEAIAHFDHRNDPLADQRKWKFTNRFAPKELEFKVSAIVNITSEEFDAILGKFNEDEKLILQSFRPTSEQLIIDRIFRKTAQPLRSYRLSGQEENDLMQRLCLELINSLPRIFYFDNFLENQFPDAITFPDDYLTNPTPNLNPDQLVIEKIFSDAGYPLKEFLSFPDSNDQSTALYEINKYINKQVMDDWEKIKLGVKELDVTALKSVAIQLVHDTTSKFTIKIKVTESFKLKDAPPSEATLDLSDRSLGFRWFFNFSIKKFFGVKSDANVIYLFDEPGSFLHNNAQGILLDAIIDLSKKHPVIFSTHSEFLLDPEKININNIRITEKENLKISLIPYAETEIEKNLGSLSTLYNALHMKAPTQTTLGQKVIITEGITDFYFWRIFYENIVFLPGHGAGRNQYLISLAIGSASNYTALFDGDSKGNEAISKYKQLFNESESNNWLSYQKSDGKPCTLEKLLSKADTERLTKLTNVKDVKKALTILHFSKLTSQFIDSIDSETKANIRINLKNISETLKLPKSYTYSHTI